MRSSRQKWTNEATEYRSQAMTGSSIDVEQFADVTTKLRLFSGTLAPPRGPREYFGFAVLRPRNYFVARFHNKTQFLSRNFTSYLISAEGDTWPRTVNAMNVFVSKSVITVWPGYQTPTVS